RALAVAGLFLVGSGDVRAAIVYNQPPDYPPNNFSFFTSDTGAGSAGFRTYDSFVLSQSAQITSVNWQGVYYDFVTAGNHPVPPNTRSWQISFFASNPGPGLPAGVLQSETLAAATVSVQFVADAVIFAPGNPIVHVLQFHADLTTPFDAQAGVQYWFSPFSL